MPTDTKADANQNGITLHVGDIVEVSPTTFPWFDCAVGQRGIVVGVNGRENVAVYFKTIKYTLEAESKVFRLKVCPHH